MNFLDRPGFGRRTDLVEQGKAVLAAALEILDWRKNERQLC
jgi:hypothetical protein